MNTELTPVERITETVNVYYNEATGNSIKNEFTSYNVVLFLLYNIRE